MKTIVIDFDRIRATLPKHGTATLHKKIISGKSVCYIECWIKFPSLSEMYPITFEKDFDMIQQWQREICGEALSVFYTEQTGLEWKIYLKRIPIEFDNVSDAEVAEFAGVAEGAISELKNKKSHE